MTRHLGSKLLMLLLLIFALGACGESGSVSEESPKGSNAQNGDSKTAKEKPEPMPKFGQTFTWDNGLSVTISKPKPYQPTELASFDKAPAYLAWDVTLVNKTGKTYDPSMFSTTAQSGDVEAGGIYDEPKLRPTPSTPLLDGRQARFQMGYSVQNPRDVVMQVDSGDFELKPVIYTN